MNTLQLMQDSYLPNLCGNAISMHRYHLMFQEIGYNDSVFVWHADRPSFEIYNGTPVYNGKGNQKNISNKISKVVKDENIDILISHSYYKDSIISKANKKTDVFKILIAHIDYSVDQKGASVEKIDDCFDLIICYKPSIKRNLINKGMPKDKLLVCPPPKDLNVFNANYDVESKNNSILYVGRIIKSKGIHKILPYLKELNAELTIVGDTNTDYYDELLAKINNLNLSNKVTFKGPLLGKALAQEYNKHSCFMLLSSSDCFSQVLQESILTELPAVALENHGAYDWTKGRAFIEKDVSSVVYRIKSILENRVSMKLDKKFAEKNSIRYLAKKVNTKIQEKYNKFKTDNKKFAWRDF